VGVFQCFYNFPRNDPLSQSKLAFYQCDEIVKDAGKFAWCTGSGWVIRRQALDNVKNFPTECLTEDVYTAVLMLAAGWKSIYVPEALQYGLLPDTYFAHIKQFTRWVSEFFRPNS
jgi:cellulose synthase/poly-beta-1,6-N-acetylglucosamine synthase-like glycosyltransferase